MCPESREIGHGCGLGTGAFLGTRWTRLDRSNPTHLDRSKPIPVESEWRAATASMGIATASMSQTAYHDPGPMRPRSLTFASKGRVLGPGALLARLERGFGAIGAGPRDVAQRHRTLDYTIGWSLRLLPAVERAAFEQCSVFAGGFTDNLAAVHARAVATAESGAGGQRAAGRPRPRPALRAERPLPGGVRAARRRVRHGGAPAARTGRSTRARSRTRVRSATSRHSAVRHAHRHGAHARLSFPAT